MAFIWSRLWDSQRSVIAEPAVGRASVPASSEDTLALPPMQGQRYAGLRPDFKARNRKTSAPGQSVRKAVGL